MYDIDLLESEWKKYNSKKRRPYYVVTLSLTALTVIGVSLFMNKELVMHTLEGLKSKNIPITESKEVFRDTSIDTLSLKKNQVGTALSLVKPVVDTNPMEPEDVLIEMRDTSKTTGRKEIKSVERRVRPKMHLEIVEMSGEKAYVDVKNRFSIAPDPDDSLFLARNYYKDKKYSKAAYWALQTNKLNGEIEESWLIFAQAKEKTGHKNEAIRVLSEYVSRSNSINAQKLLKKLKR